MSSALPGRNAAEEFERELRPNLPALMAVAKRLTRSSAEAEDLLQDTCIKAFRSRHQYRPGTNLRGWLMAILRNTFLNGYRRRALERRTLEGPDAETLSVGWVGAATLHSLRNPESGALQHALERPLLRAIDELPPDFRMVVLLADVEELSYREIANQLGCPIGTVMSRLHRARRQLRTQLLEHASALGIVPAGHAAASDSPETPVSLRRYRAKKAVS